MMFAQPHNFGDTVRKRLREDEVDGNADQPTSGFGEHRNKRLALPLRSPPDSQKRAPSLLPFALASDETDNEPPRSHFSPWSSSPTVPAPSIMNSEFDTDMVMDGVSSPTPARQAETTPQQAGLTPSGTTGGDPAGRIPTPMQPHFAAQMRSSNTWTGPGPAVAPGQLNGVTNMGHVHSGAYDASAVPRTMQTNAWPSAVSRRIPSPISEGDSQNGTASPGMCPSLAQSHGHIPSLDHSVCGSAAGHDDGGGEGGDDGMMDVSSPPSFPNNHPRQPDNYEAYEPDDSMPPLTETNSAPATPSPGRNRGHMRSRHTVNNWTWQPGMKKSFSIGYRADCEKCRLKVPGHFNHIVIS